MEEDKHVLVTATCRLALPSSMTSITSSGLDTKRSVQPWEKIRERKARWETGACSRFVATSQIWLRHLLDFIYRLRDSCRSQPSRASSATDLDVGDPVLVFMHRQIRFGHCKTKTTQFISYWFEEILFFHTWGAVALTIQQVSDLVQVDFKIRDLCKKDRHFIVFIAFVHH